MNDRNGLAIRKLGLDSRCPIKKNRSEVFCVYSPEGYFLYAAPAAEAVLGYASAELAGTSPTEYFHSDDTGRKGSYEQALAGKREMVFEYRWRKKDGSYTRLQTRLTPVLNAKGAVQCWLAVSRDNGALSKLEQAGRRLEDDFRRLFMTNPAVKLIIDHETGNILKANQAALDFYGYEAEEMRLMPVDEICADAEFKALSEAACRCRQPAPLIHKLKDGYSRNVEVYASKAILQGRPVLSLSIFDITEKKKTESACKETRERLSLVVDGAKAGIWDWDMVNNTVHFDKRWKEILGYGEGEITGGCEEWHSRWHPDDAANIEAAMNSYLGGKSEKYEVVYRLRHKDGTYRWIQTTGKLTRDQAGKPVRWTGFNIDITDNKRTEQLYLESEKRLREFAQAVPDASFIIDEDGLYLDAFGDERLLDIPKEEFRGLTVYQVLQEQDADFILNEVRQSLVSGRQRVGLREMRVGRKKVCFEGRVVPLTCVVNGKRTAAVIATDVTDQRRNERMLQLTYELRRRSDFINDVLSGKVADNESTVYLSGQLGLELDLPVFGCMILCDKIRLDIGDSLEERNESVQKVRDVMIDALRDIPDAIAWNCRDGIGVLCRATFGDSEWGRSKEIAKLIKTALLDSEPGMRIYIGISDIQTGIDGLKRIYHQALNAALAAQTATSQGVDVIHYREAGIFQILPRYFAKKDALDFMERHIGKIISYDNEKGISLLSTLERLLHDSSIRETAEKMFLHPRTVIFRRKRIEQILNVDLNAFEAKTALALAIRFHRLYNK